MMIMLLAEEVIFVVLWICTKFVQGVVDPEYLYVNDARYIGCYADRKDDNRRVLPFARTDVRSATPVTECIWNCRNYGYRYAGLQWGVECRCGNGSYDALGPCDGSNCACRRECTGNHARYCGDAWVNSVYLTTFHDARYLGCFRAQGPARSRFVLPTEVTRSLSVFSVEECLAECGQRKHMYAGLLGGGRCFCGNDTFQYREFGACNWNCSCNSPCPNDQEGACGGPTAFGIYLAVSDPQYLGCMATTSREFGYGRYGLTTQTASECKYECKRNYNYKYAGVQFTGTWSCACYDHNNHRRCELDADCSCASRCPDNATELCGGDPQGVSVFRAGCPKGSYGPLCDKSCHCYSDGCDVETGRCPSRSGCSSGWVGPRCDEACPLGSYGRDCRHHCSARCLDQECDRFTGHCLKCAPGMTAPPLCDNTCSAGSFGDQCRFKCRCANFRGCDVKTGACSDGVCAAGYQGPQCQTKCHGTFGMLCNGTCHCKHQSSCDHVTGMCLNNLCEAGYHGGDCQQECDETTFGENCASECHCKGPCDRRTGCLEECAPGWLSPPSCQVSARERSQKIAAGLLVPLALIAMVLLLLYWFVWRKRQGKKPKLDMRVSFQNLKNTFKRRSGVDNLSLEVGDLYENCCNSRRIKLCDLESYIFSTKGQENPFRAEYEALPKDFVVEPSPLGQRSDVKRLKNRFQNVIPYEHSRVPLSEENNDEASQYINASFMADYHGNISFIATQGPSEKTVRDFFRMVWEHCVPVVVMITKFVEDGKIKCAPYWDEEPGRPKTIQEFVVTVIKEDVFPEYTVRNLLLTKDMEERTLLHFHFTGWSDHGVPDNANAMLNFHRRVKRALQGTSAPAVIHCSAGIGRTGTFLALDYLLEQAVTEGAVDVFSAVEVLRRNRVNMVQNLDQYVFIYDAILEWHVVGFTSIPAKDFSSTFAEWLKPRSKKLNSKIDEQFRLLEKSREATLSSIGKAIDPKRPSRAKDRLDDIFPLESYRVKLVTDTTIYGDYINAVFVDGYKRPSAFIATQIPLTQTRVDLWRMVKDYNISCIVCFTDDKDFQDKAIPYWPEEDEEVTEGPFTVSCSASNQMGNLLTCVSSDLTLTYKTGTISYERHLRLLNVMWYSERDSYGPTSDLLELLATVTRWQQTQPANTKVAVQSLYGCDKCGVFLTMNHLIDMLNAEQEVDIFQVVKRIRKPRPQFIRNIEQYKYLYEVVESYTSAFHLYSNFS